MTRSGTRTILSLVGGGAGMTVANAAGGLVATAALGLWERGAMVLAVTIGSIIALVTGLGTGTSLRSRLPRETDPVRRARLLSSYFWLCCGSAVCAGLVAALTVRVSSIFIDHTLASGTFIVAVAVSTMAQ